MSEIKYIVGVPNSLGLSQEQCDIINNGGRVLIGSGDLESEVLMDGHILRSQFIKQRPLIIFRRDNPIDNPPSSDTVSPMPDEPTSTSKSTSPQ